MYSINSNSTRCCSFEFSFLVNIFHFDYFENTKKNNIFSYILYVPFETDDDLQSGIVYVWLGSKSSPEETKLIQEIAENMFNNPWVSLQVS